MKWTPGGPSADLEDRRGESPGYSRAGFGGMSMGRMGPIGLGGLAILFVISLLTGQDFLGLLGGGGGSDPGYVPGPSQPGAPAPTGPANATPEENTLRDFVSFVLDDAQDTWTQQLPGRYQRAKLVLFRDAIQSACGFAEAATGPFYCPGDQKVYIDLGFYDELRRRFGAPGDFAQAYVLAHEIGHHVQDLLGTERQMRQAQRARPDQANELSVRLELQADCYAGIWGHSAAQRGKLDPDDVDEGLRAAAAIGDDRIQRMSGARVAPERFTHGSSEQRVEWFKRGLQTGQMSACDTFR
jgi:predicted metalloprotease